MDDKETVKSSNFIRDIIDGHNADGAYGGAVVTRFPPEPNGYLHIGHAKSICLNFGLAKEYNGRCHLRFDDTNPIKEEVEYIESIQTDVRWLGWDWGRHLYYASDYYQKFYEYALQLIRAGKAYVCNLSPDQIREYRGTLTRPGTESPYRNRSSNENLELFEKMKNGGFKEGEAVLRAKIDMNSPNLNMRDPVMYRILHSAHHRTGNAWRIYAMYDYAHCVSDSIEGITHSICTLEFEDHRPLYDWFLTELGIYRPQQIEFARLNLTYTVMSKRKLLELVDKKYVSGWNDPRLPTISGLRRRGFTPASIRDFCDRIGVAKSNSVVDYALLEHCLREELNLTAPRAMAVLKPLKLVITNYPEARTEELDAENNPEKPEAGIRKITFGRDLYIEQDDFQEVPAKGFFRLSPGKEVRLKNAFYITCTEAIKDGAGKVLELRCTYDPATKGGWSTDGRKVKGTLHWVYGRDVTRAEVRLYDQLFKTANHDDVAESEDYTVNLNPESLTIIPNAMIETSLATAKPGDRYQFLRHGYFIADPIDSRPGKPVFNRIVGLRDTWAKQKSL